MKKSLLIIIISLIKIGIVVILLMLSFMIGQQRAVAEIEKQFKGSLLERYQTEISYEDVVWQAVQRWKAVNNGYTYYKSDLLCASAEERSKEIDTDWSHDKFEINRWVYTQSNYIKMGENLARDYQSPLSVVPAWANSPSHFAIMNDIEMTEGCVKCEGAYCVLHVGKRG